MGFLLVLGAIFFLLMSFVLVPRMIVRSSHPEIFVYSPALGKQVTINGETLIHAIASDPIGVTRVELWIDEQLVASEDSQLAKGSTPFPIMFDWEPEGLGLHTLMVRAYNSEQLQRQVKVTVEAADLPRPQAYVFHRLQDGEAPGEVSVLEPGEIEELLAEHPELEAVLETDEAVLIPSPMEPSEEGEPPDEASVPASDRFGTLPPEMFAPQFVRIPDFMSGLYELSAIILEVEALEMTVDQPYSAVSCYVSLADSPYERVPAEDYMWLERREVNIDYAMGGENRRIVMLPEGMDHLDVKLECLGFIRYLSPEEGEEVFDLGTLETTHFEDDWDGRRLEHWAMGQDGWFRVVYRITRPGVLWSGEGPFPPPIGLSKRCFENVFIDAIMCVLTWDYPEEYLDEITGFEIRLNGEPRDIVYAHEPRTLLLTEGSGIPYCGEEYAYQVVAYLGNTSDPSNVSSPSNTVVLSTEVCQTRKVRVTYDNFYVTGGACEGDCMFARLWANGHETRFGEANDFCLCHDWACDQIYSVDELAVLGEGNPLEFELGPYEYLEIMLRVYKHGGGGNALRCEGGIPFTPDDLRAIAASPGRSIRRAFVGTNGDCQLKFTVEVTPIISIHDFDPYRPSLP
jgi:hypothetical protein